MSAASAADFYIQYFLDVHYMDGSRHKILIDSPEPYYVEDYLGNSHMWKHYNDMDDEEKDYIVEKCLEPAKPVLIFARGKFNDGAADEELYGPMLRRRALVECVYLCESRDSEPELAADNPLAAEEYNEVYVGWPAPVATNNM